MKKFELELTKPMKKLKGINFPIEQSNKLIRNLIDEINDINSQSYPNDNLAFKIYHKKEDKEKRITHVEIENES